MTCQPEDNSLKTLNEKNSFFYVQKRFQQAPFKNIMDLN